MERRTFLTLVSGSLLATPLAAEAQPVGKVVRVGWLTLVPPTSSEIQTLYEIFRRGMRDLGWVEGRNMVIEVRHGAGRQEPLPEAAAELVRLGVDVIVTWAPLGVAAAKKATSTIPIVMPSVGDPVALGLVANFARPGGNITGLTQMAPDHTGKRLELLKELLPKATRVAFVRDPANPGMTLRFKEAQVAAPAGDYVAIPRCAECQRPDSCSRGCN